MNVKQLKDKVADIRLAQQEMEMAKEKIETPVLRKPYYETGDKIGALEEAAAELRDKKLQDLVKKMYSVQTEIRNHINATYIWD